MKKFTNFLIAIVVAAMGFVFQSCGGATAAGLASSMNANCPADWGNGVTLDNVVADDSWVVLNCTFPDGANLDALANADESVKASFVSEIKAQNSDVVEACAALGVGFKYVFKNSEGSATIEIPADMLK